MTDDQFNKLILYTDGRQLQKSSDQSRQEIPAHWDGSHLVSDEKSPLGGKMNRTFELSQDGRQLYETLHIDNGRSKTPLVIRYVYDAAANSDIQPGGSDPNRPVLKRRTRRHQRFVPINPSFRRGTDRAARGCARTPPTAPVGAFR